MPLNIIRSWTLQQWSEGFYGIYGKNDSLRTLSNFWIQVCNDASKVAEAVRRYELEHAMYHLGNAFCWTCCFAERLHADMNQFPIGKQILKEKGPKFQDWILKRYPFVCHHCGYVPCHCVLYTEIVEKRNEDEKYEKKYQSQVAAKRDKKLSIAEKELKKNKNKIVGYSLDKLFSKFYQIYGNDVTRANLDSLTFHYLEETGEVAKAVTTLETLIGINDSKNWSKLQRSDKKLSLTKKHGKNWKPAFQQAKEALVGETKKLQKLDSLERSKKAGSIAYTITCKMILDELADVFSWSTAIVYKIAKLRKKEQELSITGVFVGDSDVVGDKSVKSYVYGTPPRFRCPYCAKDVCSLKCPLSGILSKVIESQLKGN